MTEHTTNRFERHELPERLSRVGFLLLFTAATTWMMLSIEKRSQRLLGGQLSTFQRRLIFVPAGLLLVANLSGAASCRVYWHAHPRAALIRSPEYQAWDSSWIAFAGLAGIVLPFVLARFSCKAWRVAPCVWGLHFLWPFLYALLLLQSGVPLQD